MKRFLAASIALLSLLVLFPGTVLAVETGFPFLVEIIIPENSIDPVGYYHVPGTPNETIALQAKLTNRTDEPIEVYAIPLNAYSGPEGILYQSPDDIDAQTFALADPAYGMAQYIKTQPVYTIAPKSAVTANILVTVPDIDTGTLLGSIRFRVYNGTQEITNQDSGGSTILIDEYLAIDTAIQIDLPAAAAPAVSAGVPSLTDKGLCIPIVNQAARITEAVSGAYEIRDSNDSILLQGSAVLPKMAPMTVWNLLAPWDGAWKEGEYTLIMRLDINGQASDCVQPFTVGEAAVSQMIESQQSEAAQDTAEGAVNAAASASPDTGLNTVIKGIAIGIPVVFISILLLLIIKKQKKKKLLRLRLLSEKRYIREA